MNIKELTYKVGYKKVFNQIYKIYLGDKNNKEVQEYDCKFCIAWNNLSKLNHKASEDQDVENSCIFIGDCPEDDKHFVDVCLRNKINNETYGVDFLPWENFIEKEIETDLKLTPEVIAAHILWEITFWGWDSKAVQASGSKILEEADDVIDKYESL